MVPSSDHNHLLCTTFLSLNSMDSVALNGVVPIILQRSKRKSKQRHSSQNSLAY